MKKYTEISFLLFIITTFLLPFTAYAEETWTSYIGQNQLNGINDIAVEGDYVWCATDGGVVRWNILEGTYIIYTHDDGLINNMALSISVDSDSVVWVGTLKGLSIIQDDQWTSYKSIDFERDDSWTTISSIVTDLQGQKWFNTGSHTLIRFDGSTWRTFTTDDGLARGDVLSIDIDSGNGIWTGHRAQSRYSGKRGGITYYDGFEWIHYEHNDGLGGASVHAVAVDMNDTKWFASRGVDGVGIDSITKFDGETWSTYTADDGLVSNLVNTIYVDKNNNKWFGTDEGVSIYSELQWTTITTANGLCDNHVNKIKSDSQGNMYFGTSNGLSIKKDDIWQTLKVTDGLTYGSICSIAVDRNGVKWFATCDRRQNNRRPFKGSWRDKGYGAVRFDGESWITYTEEDGLVNNTIRDVAVDHDNNVWFATPSGISKFNGTTWNTFTEFDGIECNDVYSIAIEKGSIMWFGTYAGVSRFDGNTWTNYHVQEFYGDNCGVTDIAIDTNGVKWFAIYESIEHDGGIVSFDNANWTLYPSCTGLINTEVLSIAADINNDIWVGTDDLLMRYDGSTWYRYYRQEMLEYTGSGWKTVKEDTITPSGGIYSIAVEPNGVKWISTYTKVFRYTGDTIEEYDTTFLPGESIFSMAVGNDGSKWFGSRDGVLTIEGQEPYQYIQILSPSGRDSLDSDSSCEIRWNSNDIDLVKLSYSIDNGENWTTIDENVNALDGSYVWTVPDVESEECFLRITDQVAESIVGRNYNPFTIIPTNSNGEPTHEESEWINFANMNNINSLVNDGEYILSATTAGVVKWNIHDRTVNETFTTADGLYSNKVYAIAVGDNGYTWFGTADRVTFFDGTTWGSSSIPGVTPQYVYNDYYISALAVDHQGLLWAGTSYGAVASYDGNSWDIHIQGTSEDFEPVTCICIDNDNVKWVGTYENGVYRYDGESWSTYTTAHGLASNNVNAIAIDEHNVKWFATTGGVSTFDGSTWGKYTKADGLSGTGVSAIAVDNNGVKWFGTNEFDEREIEGSGVCSFDGSSWVSYTTDNGLNYDYVSSIVIDTNGFKWFGFKDTETYSGYIDYPGIQTFNDTNWETVIKDGLVSNWIYSIAFEENGTAWIGTKNGVMSFDGTTWKSHNRPGARSPVHAVSMCIDNKNIKWFGDADYVVSYDGITWKSTELDDYPEINNILSIIEDHNGDLWFGSEYDGVYKFNGNVWGNYSTINSGLDSDNVGTVIVDNNNVIWIGSRKSVSSYDGLKWNNYSSRDILSRQVTSLAVDKNNTVWGGQEDGGGLFTINENGLSEVTPSDTVDPLYSIRAIGIDNNNVKWFGGEYRGIMKFDDTSWESIQEQDGLISNYITTIAFAPNGNVWIGTENGISCYEYDSPTSVKQQDDLNKAFPVLANYPNPFNPSTTISYNLINEDFTYLVVYNIMGQKVRTLIAETMPSGNHSIRWDGNDENGQAVSSGIYIVQLRTKSYSTAHKMLLIK